MNYKRSDRLAAVIQEEMSNVLLHGTKDPAFGFITITKVKVTDDNRHAKIYYSVLGDEKKKQESQEALERAKGFFRSELGHRIRIRFVPTVTFVYDDSTEYADHIEQLIKQINKE